MATNETDEDSLASGTSRMSFLDHLDELRRRILYSVYSVCGGLVISLFFIQDVMALITSQMIASTPSGKLLGSGPLDPIMVIFKPGLLFAVVISSPLILLQVWYFIAPGLYANEKRFAIPFVFASTMLFLAGAWFGHHIAFPVTWGFLGGMIPDWLEWNPAWADAFSLYLRMVLGLGLIFQMPVIIFVLARFGLVTWRFLLKKTKYAVLIIFIVAGIASPGTDLVSQLIFAVPMLVLYAISIGVAWIVGKRKAEGSTQ